DQIIKRVLQRVLYYREILLEEPMRIVDEFNSLSLTKDREVTVIDTKGSYRAKAIGMDLDGTLKVMTPDGEIKKITSGDVEMVLG
ncbi:MAG: hypothetical protein D6778_05705, partial [Nitrospirae bacterium]